MTPAVHSLISANSSYLNEPAIITTYQTLSYAQLLNAVDLCAVKLQGEGVKAKDRIAIAEQNSFDYIIALLALWSIKAVACPLSIRLPENTLNDQLKQINARRIATSSLIDLSALSSPSASSQDLNCDKDQPGTIIFTSGTSARPKAVLHTLGNHIANAQGANESVPLEPGDRWMLSLPLYHVGGLGILFRCLLAKAAMVIPEPGETLGESLSKNRITHLSVVPTQMVRLLGDTVGQSYFMNLKAILLGGSAIPKTLLNITSKLNLPVYTTYGMTEMASQIATSRFPQPATILNNREVKISNEGEILVKGETLCQGYIQGNAIDLPLLRDGWFATGDLGTLDHEGHLNVIGRKDNMFISGGENIQPEEIEQYLCRIDLIEDAVVVPHPDKEFGFRPIGFIKYDEDKMITKHELDRFLQNYLPKFKVPERYYAWPESPGDAMIKPNRRYLSEIIQTGNRLLQEIK